MSSKNIDDYVQPPSYNEIQISDDSLIEKLRTRIRSDLNQINGVYDAQIKEAEQIKGQKLHKLELEYQETIRVINSLRNKDISNYNNKAEKHINDLILSMHNVPLQLSWWKKMFG